MNNVIKYGMWITIILAVVMVLVYIVFINTFHLFGDPEKLILDSKCNSEGTVQATTYTLSGNAVTERSIIVSVKNECGDETKDVEEQIVFSAEYRIGSILTSWLSCDTLEVLCSHHIEPFIHSERVDFEKSSPSIKIVYRYEIETSDIMGNWYTISQEEGYDEFNIDISVLQVFSYYYGTNPAIYFDIVHDSIKYRDSDFAATISMLSDSMLLWNYYGTADTLYRISDSIHSLYDIDYKNDSVFREFYWNFEHRAYQAMKKHGYGNDLPFEEWNADTSDYDEEFIRINRRIESGTKMRKE